MTATIPPYRSPRLRNLRRRLLVSIAHTTLPHTVSSRTYRYGRTLAWGNCRATAPSCFRLLTVLCWSGPEVAAEQKARNDDADPFTLLVVDWPAHRCAGERGEATAGGVGSWWTPAHARSRCAASLARWVAGHVVARYPLCHC